MTLRSSRALKNMILICGTVCTGSFCTALGTAKKHAFKGPSYAAKPKFTGPIESLSNLEDFARSNNCTFLFYKKGTNSAKEGRAYLAGMNGEKKENEKKIVTEANKHKANCTENSFVFSEIQQ